MVDDPVVKAACAPVGHFVVGHSLVAKQLDHVSVLRRPKLEAVQARAGLGLQNQRHDVVPSDVRAVVSLLKSVQLLPDLRIPPPPALG